MRLLRLITRLLYATLRVLILVGVVVYVALFVATNLPVCQRWTATAASRLLTRELGSDVTVGALRIGLFNRLVANDLLLLDLEGDTLLSAARISAKVDVVELTRGRVRLDYVQLFGYDIRLRRHDASSPYNFQHIVDRLVSADDGPSTTDVAIESILIRRGRLSHHIGDAPLSPTFTPAHFCLDSLSLRARVDELNSESLSLTLSQLSLSERLSGLSISDGSLHLNRRDSVLTLSDFVLRLPSSTVAIPEASLLLTDSLSAANLTATATLEANLTLPDFAPLYAPLATWSVPLRLSSSIDISNGLAQATTTAYTDNGVELKASVETRADSLLDISALRSLKVEQLQLPHAFTDATLAWLSAQPSVSSVATSLRPILAKAGDISLTTDVVGNGNVQDVSATIATDLLAAELSARLTDRDRIQAHLQADDVALASLLGEGLPLRSLSLQTDVEASLSQRRANATLTATDLHLDSRTITAADATIAYSPELTTVALTTHDPTFALHMEGSATPVSGVAASAPLYERYAGEVALSDVTIASDSTSLHVDSMLLAVGYDAESRQRHVSLQGDAIEAHADGVFTLQSLPQAFTSLLADAFPSLLPEGAGSKATDSDLQDVVVDIRLRPQATDLFALAGIDVQLPADAHVHGRLDSRQRVVSLSSSVPHIVYSGNDLRQLSLSLIEQASDVVATMSMQRVVAEGPVAINIRGEGSRDNLAASIIWDNHLQPAMRGELSTTAHFFRSDDAHLGAHVQVHPSQVVVQDTTWNVHASTITLRDGGVDIRDLHASQLGRSLSVSGRVSASESDTLHADLQGLNLQYVFGLLNFHDLEFGGHATGHVTAHSLMGTPAVDAQLRIPDFTINGGSLGDLTVNGGFGRQDERAIDLDALITEPRSRAVSHVRGLIKPGRAPGRGLDLDVAARRLDISFLNDFTHSFLTDLQGNASGHAHVYGPFAAIDLEGDLLMDTVSVTLDYLGHRYHSLGGDSVHLRPGRLYTDGLTLCDAHHRLSRPGHTATLRGQVLWEHFKNIRYDFRLSADDVLGYDFRDFGDEVFCGTIYARGDVHIAGRPGAIDIDLKGSPAAGTTFTYNATSPETLTDAAFITFTSRQDSEDVSTDKTASNAAHGDDDRTDLRLNFDIDMTPAAAVRLLMDARSDDYITLHGDGHLRATYYNKGRFQMYGTYRVDHGSYRLSLQDVIRKDFQFERGGTIVFGGTPMNADLNLRAIYTLPSVSLNELATGANFAQTNVRVNCLMDITGRAAEPQVAFDFDIPNVNEDEKQMVRSLISTEEERNMQVIYLLGIGRFYTYEYAAEQSQTGTAMNGLLSSTLSGQLNDLLTNAIGNSNWSFGTNLTTGQTGWSNVDVEGMLSGRLLNNRLLINGTFGYRDTPIANNNFIGDFDVQWYLTPSGGLSLKAYSETNDRYFTKSALTTQGIGVQVRRDFRTLGDFFRRRSTANP